MWHVYKSSRFLVLFCEAFACLSASLLSHYQVDGEFNLERSECNGSCSTTGSWNTSSISTASRESHLMFHSTSKDAVTKRQVVDHIMMDGFVGEMHLDAQKRDTDFLLPLNINIATPAREVSGSFFNFHDHKPTFKLDTKDQRRVNLTGGPLTAPYIMDQFHFHIHCTRKQAEENTLDRVQVPGEIHLVFFREKYRSYNKALHRFRDGLAVVAIYLEVHERETSHPLIANLAQLVDYISHDENRKVSTAADIKQLTAPVDKINAQYEAYRGKIVEPIQCENCVDVFVMKERFTISVKQMMEFRKAPHCVENDWSF